MKKLYAMGALAAVLLSSCSTAYQVVETASADVKTNGNAYEFGGEDLTVSYNLWDGAGTIYFNLHNNTDDPLFVDLDRSHLIVNGQSFDYYQDKETSTSSKTGSTRPSYFASTIWTNQMEVSVKSKPKRVIEIPPHSFINVGGLAITEGVKNCGMTKPKSGVSTSPTFTVDNTPLQFRNYVTYSVRQDFGTSETIDNSFYATRVVNLTESAFKGKSKKYKECPDDDFSKEGYEMPYSKAQNIYVKVKQ